MHRQGTASRRNPILAAVALIVAGAGCAPNPSLPASPGPTASATSAAPPATSVSPTAGAAATPSPDPGSRLRLVIDTDMAPDDVVAIASLLRDPAVEVLAITVVGTGEAHCPGGLFVARAIVTMLRGTPVPVACGLTTPIGDAAPFPAEWRAGADAGNGLRLVSPTFVPDPRSSQALLVELADAEAAASRRLTILTLGTLTNLAAALELDPGLPGKVRIISMLGAVTVPGNVEPEIFGGGEPTAEWNAHADPTAVRRVLEAGFDLTLVPLDATNSAPLTPDLYRRLEADHAAGPADLVFELWARNPYMTSGGFYLWDPLAAAVIRDPTLVTTRAASLRVVEGAELDGGRLVEDPEGSPVTIATSADQARFEAFLLSSLRIGGPRAETFEPVAVIRISIGPETCDVSFDPSPPPAGLLRVEGQSTVDGTASAFVFGTAGITWAELEAFAREPDFDHPPDVADVAGVFLEAPGSGTGWGEARAGPLGVACATGDVERPDILLRGPFELAP